MKISTDKEGVFLSRPEKRQQHQMAAERPETIVCSGGNDSFLTVSEGVNNRRGDKENRKNRSRQW